MAIDRDGATSLPTPPPPRPARRQAAIETALRKFDGVEEEPGRPARSGWAGSHRYQLGGLVTAALVAVVAIPATLIVLREQPPAVAPETPAPAIVQQDAAQATELAEPQSVAPTRPVAAETPAQTAPPSAAISVPHERRSDAAPLADAQEAAGEAPGAYAAPAPPPPAPPPPPPASPATAEQAVGQADEIVLTGSRMREPNLSKERNAKAVASPQRAKSGYAPFLASLQGAVRANDRSAIVRMIAFPLRVNQGGRSRTYRSAESVERDFDQIFTARVRRAILNQRGDQLFVRDQGAMIGDGEVWFDQSCRNSDCSAAGPVRILAVNP